MHDYDAILIAIRRITRAIDLHSKQLVKQSGLTVPQVLVMQAIGRGGREKPISQIAQDVCLSQATVTSVIDRLERAGLVQRARSGSDKRMVHASLTAAGAAKLAEAPDPMQTAFIRQFRQLESWEQHQLVAALERIAAMMDAGDIDASPILEIGEIERP